MFDVVPSLNQIAAVAFRLVLAVSLWPGPIPWGHEHFTTQADLHDHLVRCHAQDPEGWQTGWHWHFSLPGSHAPLSDCRHPDQESDGLGYCFVQAMNEGSTVPSANGTAWEPLFPAWGAGLQAPERSRSLQSPPPPFPRAAQILLCRLSC